MSTCAFACTSTAAQGSVGDITRLILSAVGWWLHILKVFILRLLFVQTDIGAESSDEGWKKPDVSTISCWYFFFSGVICFELMWIQKSAPGEVTALISSLYDGTRKLLHLDFRTPRHTRAYCSYMQPDNIIQAGLCLNTNLQAAVKRTIRFYSESHSPVHHCFLPDFELSIQRSIPPNHHSFILPNLRLSILFITVLEFIKILQAGAGSTWSLIMVIKSWLY